MSPLGPYTSFDDCVSKNSDKSSPEAFCAWMEHKISGQWPGEKMSLPKEAFEVYFKAYEGCLDTSKKEVNTAEKEAHFMAMEAVKQGGWLQTAQGWTKQFTAPKMKTVTGVKVFASGTHTDSSGMTKKWTEKDLDRMVEAFNAHMPQVVPLKVGHTIDSFNKKVAEALGVPPAMLTGDTQGRGSMGLGQMATLERKGSLLFATFERVPESVANFIESGHYTAVSAEVQDKDGDYGPVITGVAFLGTEEPAVKESSLEMASVFAKREGATVYTFSDAKTNSFFGDLMARLTEFMGQKESKGEKPMHSLKGVAFKDYPAKFQVGSDELLKVAASLGLTETATIDDILTAIENIKKQVEGVAGKGATPEAMAQAFSKVNTDLAALRRELRIREVEDKTRLFTSIEGTPRALAERVVDIEIKGGKEAGESMLAAFAQANKASFDALQFRGTNRGGSVKGDEFEKKVQEFQKAGNLDRAGAIRQAMTEFPALYREYTAEQEAKSAIKV